MTHLSTRKHVLALVLTTFCFLCVPHTFVHASNSKYARQRRRQQERQRQSQPKQQKQARSSVCSKPRQNTGCVGGEQWLVVSEGKSHYSAQRAQALCMDACARASELKKGNTCCFFKGTACYLKPGASVVTNVPAEFRGGMSAVCQYRPSETPTVSFVVNITLQCLCQAEWCGNICVCQPKPAKSSSRIKSRQLKLNFVPFSVGDDIVLHGLTRSVEFNGSRTIS